MIVLVYNMYKLYIKNIHIIQFLHLRICLNSVYLYFIDHVIFISNDRFFKNKYNPIIFITIINDE